MRSQIFAFISLVFASSLATADSLIVFDASGRGIGYYFSATCDSSGNYFGVYSRTGYFACVSVDLGSIDQPISPPGAQGETVYTTGYSKPNCEGQRFAYSVSPEPFTSGFVSGNGPDVPPVYTVNNGATSLMTALASNQVAGGACQELSSGFQQYALPILDNNIAITGISSVRYSPPLRVQPAPDSVLDDTIFFDTFDG